MILFETVWIRLNLLQTINAYSKRVVFVLYLPRQCSATKPLYCSWVLSRFIRSRWITLKYFIFGYCKVLQRSKLATKCKFLSGEGFEPSISMRVRLKLTALDRSANLTFLYDLKNIVKVWKSYWTGGLMRQVQVLFLIREICVTSLHHIKTYRSLPRFIKVNH